MKQHGNSRRGCFVGLPSTLVKTKSFISAVAAGVAAAGIAAAGVVAAGVVAASVIMDIATISGTSVTLTGIKKGGNCGHV